MRTIHIVNTASTSQRIQQLWEAIPWPPSTFLHIYSLISTTKLFFFPLQAQFTLTLTKYKLITQFNELYFLLIENMIFIYGISSLKQVLFSLSFS